MNKYIITLLLFTYLANACQKENIEPLIVKPLYKYDSINIKEEKYVIFDKSIFLMKNNNLYLKDPDNTIDRLHKIEYNQRDYWFKIVDWKEDLYSLIKYPYDNNYPLLNYKDTLFFISGGLLKYSVQGNVTDCCSFRLMDPMYNQMVAEDGFYAIRTGTKAYVSTDLKNWDLIYDNKRGITKSLALVKNTMKECELLISEYTPGNERHRHHILKYNFATKQIKKVFTFYKANEGLIPFARHIHILEKDPYTGDIWVGTGDSDLESSIYRSTDSGETFHLVGSGTQKWRVLAFIFTPEYIFWNTDSHEPQYLTRVNRKDLTMGQIAESVLKRFSIINGACWGVINMKTQEGDDMIIMSSNNEGGLYDEYSRTYGIVINNAKPEIFELTKIKARTVYTQLFPIEVNAEGRLVLFDHEVKEYASYELEKCKN